MQALHSPPSSWQSVDSTVPEVAHAKVAVELVVVDGGALVIVTDGGVRATTVQLAVAELEPASLATWTANECAPTVSES